MTKIPQPILAAVPFSKYHHLHQCGPPALSRIVASFLQGSTHVARILSPTPGPCRDRHCHLPPPGPRYSGRRPDTAQGLHRVIQRQGPVRLAWHAALQPLQTGGHAGGRTQDPDREMDGGCQEALDGRQRRTGQRRQRRLPDHRQGLWRHRVARRIQDGRPRPTAASTCAARRRCRSGITPRKAANGTSAPTRAAAACGTTAPARPARIRSCWPTSRSANGTPSASSWSANGSPSISTTSSSSTTPGWRTSGTTSCRC